MTNLRHTTPAGVPAVLEFWELAADGEHIVGSVIAGWDGWRCHLYRLAVAPARRREGIGRALLLLPRSGSGPSVAPAARRWC